MTDRRLLVSAAALAMASVAISGCGRSPYPEPSRMTEPPPSAGAPELMGAPDGQDQSGAPRGDAYPQAPEGLQAAPEPPGGAPPYPPADQYAPGAPPATDASAPPPPPRIITMEPIPNPPERAHSSRRAHRPHAEGSRAARPIFGSRRERRAARAERQRHARVHRRFGRVASRSAVRRPLSSPNAAARKPVARPPAPAARSRRSTVPARAPVHGASKRPAPVPTVRAPVKAAPETRAHGQATTEPHRILPPKPVQVAKPAPALVKPAAPSLQAAVRPEVAPSAARQGGNQGKHAVTGRTPSAAPNAEGGAKLAALSGALGPIIASRSVLKGGDDLKTGAPGDVSLSVPADFADNLRDEAKRTGFADAAASAALAAKLSGDGYAVSPAEAQSQPLVSGKPTDFRWTVTKMDAARGPLQAEVGADFLGGGKQHLDFGAIAAAKAPTGFKLSPRALGVGLLLLVVILAGALLSGGRRSREQEVAGPDTRS